MFASRNSLRNKLYFTRSFARLEGGMGDENLEHQTGGIEPACIGSGLFFTGRTFCQAQLAHESGPGKL